ncbi:MAG: mutL [Firmicutes bacterium]|nr:mutL [Bacillota bacterium]
MIHSARIHILDEKTANKIAAGEVVERPSSIVKELVENSLDAASQTIEIEIAAGGIEYIRVTDDGFGMSRQDAELAVLRHATSKISSADDLYNINSLGFRGEALPSIAAVAEVTLKTRLSGDDFATCLEITGGSVLDVFETGAGLGTTITVANLFFNTPARRKFLKTPQGEGSHIHDIVVKLALSRPDVAFKLIHNQKLVLTTPGNSQLMDTLSALYGQKVTPDLIPLEYAMDGITVSGYIGKPTLLKSNRSWQTFIVNGRIVNSRMISKAIDNAYHSLLPKNGHPLAVVSISIPADVVDVNVHPQKSEVKFSDEQKIFRAVYKAILSVLEEPQSFHQIAALPKITWSPKPQQPALWHEQPASFEPRIEPKTLQSPEPPAPSVSFLSAMETIQKSSEIPAVSLLSKPAANAINETNETTTPFRLYPLGQIAACYIVAQGIDGLYLIDQHAAHERILYDRFSRHSDSIPSQQLLIPLYLEFDQQEIDLVLQYQETFRELGFLLDSVGPLTLRLLEIPIDLPTAEAEAVVRDTLSFIQNTTQPTAQGLRHACLQTSACRAAIKAGDTLNMRQIQALMDELCAANLPYTCPHGRPAVVRFTEADLAKLFKRT